MLLMFALPAGMISSGFMEEVWTRRMKKVEICPNRQGYPWEIGAWQRAAYREPEGGYDGLPGSIPPVLLSPGVQANSHGFKKIYTTEA